jgi:uncharacterized RDD family membrane protein YckC
VTTTPAPDPAGPPPEPAPGHARHGVDVVPPEARPFQGQHAGLITRLLANTVDFVVVVVIVAAGYAGVAAVRFLWNSRTFSFPTAPFLVFLLAGSAVMVVYLAVAWTVTGRTYGDHLLGLRVVGRHGRPPRVGGALLRALACVLFPVGLFWVAVSRENRSIQDVVLRYAVVYDWAQRSVPPPDPEDASEPEQGVQRHGHEQQ